mmetsp:Transcript_41645/g.114895  ORF Transcript_41645/g.114895 Transcript_41645/m.114895 type:complete len:221 (+) Transcript_41645:466-1128(+)
MKALCCMPMYPRPTVMSTSEMKDAHAMHAYTMVPSWHSRKGGRTTGSRDRSSDGIILAPVLKSSRSNDLRAVQYRRAWRSGCAAVAVSIVNLSVHGQRRRSRWISQSQPSNESELMAWEKREHEGATAKAKVFMSSQARMAVTWSSGNNVKAHPSLALAPTASGLRRLTTFRAPRRVESGVLGPLLNTFKFNAAAIAWEGAQGSRRRKQRTLRSCPPMSL